MASAKSHALDELNGTIERIRSHIPKQPYLQTIPQDGSRWQHHTREAAEAWRRNLPFDADDPAELQYQTFFYHEHGTDLIHLRVRSPARDTHRERPRSDTAADKTRSVTGTPLLAATKKKISLADYKNQKGAGTKPSGDDKGHMAKGTHAASKRGTGAEGAEVPPLDPSTRDFADSDSARLKRKRQQHGNAPRGSPSPIRRKVGDEPEEHHARRPGMRSQAGSRDGGDSSRKDKDADATGMRHMPSPLSPLGHMVPGRLSPLGNVLPDLLTPGLPPTVLAELEDRARLRLDTSSARSHSPAQSPKGKHDSAHAREGGSKTSEESVKGNGQSQDGEDTGSRTKLKDTHQSKTGRESPRTINIKGLPVDDHDPLAKPRRLLVKLKIPKRLRQDAKRLLKFPPHPMKFPSENTTTTSSSAPDEPRIQTTERSEESRQALSRLNDFPIKREESNHQQRKRSRSPSSIDPDPSGRHRSRLKSETQSSPPPFPSQQTTAARHAQTTPQSKPPPPTSASMKRMSSVDGFLVCPAAAVARTPASSTPAPQIAPVSASLRAQAATSTPSKAGGGGGGTSNAAATASAWEREATRFLGLGRALKASGQELSASPGQHERGLLVTIESLCAFCMSFYCSDRAASVSSSGNQSADTPGSASSTAAAVFANARKTWLTNHGLWKKLLYDARHFPVVRAFVVALGEVYLGRACAWWAQHAPPGGGSSEHQGPMAEVSALLGRIVDVSPRLNVALVRRDFPGVWERWLSQNEGERDEVEVGRYGQKVDVSVGFGAGIVVAVRTLLVLMSEYKCKDGRRFEGTFMLDRP